MALQTTWKRSSTTSPVKVRQGEWNIYSNGSSRPSKRCPRSPERGSNPRELLDLGVREHRQLLFKLYRMIYRVMDDTVYVLVIADGRRDIPALLERRLFSA